MNPEDSSFTIAVEELELLLHSETQAIVESDIDKLELILSRKEIALDNVLTEKERIEVSHQEDPVLEELLERILQLQQRNKHTLDNLVDSLRQNGSIGESGLRIRKIRNAYLTHHKEKDGRMLDI